MVLRIFVNKGVVTSPRIQTYFLVDMNKGIFLLKAILKLAWAKP